MNGSKMFTGEDGVTVTVISDGGGLGRRSGSGRLGTALAGDEGWVPSTGEAWINVERKREERKKARESFTDDVFSRVGEESEAAAKGRCGARACVGAMQV
jgi:hypothetical protein